MTLADDKLLKDKKIKFEFEVEKAAEILKVHVNQVVFHNGREHFNKDERAHIHLDTKTICISEQELKLMSYEDIRTTASHEVSHLVHEGHDTDFWNTQTETESLGWSPPSGVTHVVYRNAKSKDKNIDSKKWLNYCQYHDCKVKKKLVSCAYCHEKFCKLHVVPFTPKLGTRDDTSLNNDSDNGHPCFRYNLQKEFENNQKDDEYRENLDSLLRKKKIVPNDGPLIDSKMISNVEKYLDNIPNTDYNRSPSEDDEDDSELEDELDSGETNAPSSGKLSKVKCFFGFHSWKKFMGYINVGDGKFSQKYKCERCNKIKEEIG